MIESKKTFNLLEEHPSHRCMVMSERSHCVIPCINSLNLLPNIADLHQLEETDNPQIMDLRENYSAIILLLFCSYCSQDDLKINGSYWEKYKYVIDNNMLSTKRLEVIQNIQDVSHNCSNLKQAQDELTSSTVFTPHEEDRKTNCNEEENKISIDEFEDLFQQLDDHGIRDVDANKRRLNIIGQRHKIVQQDIPIINTTIPDITDIPDGIKVTNNSMTNCNDNKEINIPK